MITMPRQRPKAKRPSADTRTCHEGGVDVRELNGDEAAEAWTAALLDLYSTEEERATADTAPAPFN